MIDDLAKIGLLGFAVACIAVFILGFCWRAGVLLADTIFGGDQLDVRLIDGTGKDKASP